MLRRGLLTLARPGNSEDIGALADLLADGDVLVLSGAGMSTDSGIPDYRGPTGTRRRASPMTYREFTGDDAARRRYWARSHVGWRHVASARPNAAHRAVAALEAGGVVSGVVTQNVDGLHTAAGSRRVIDLHGRLDTVVCLGCGDRRPRIEIALRLAALNPAFDPVAATAPDGDADLADAAVAGFRTADCRLCHGPLKPDVVFFGESVAPQVVAEAMTMLDDARVLLVLGSSLTVMSGYRFVLRARKRGTPVAIVNRGPTRGDDDADVRLDASLGVALPAVVEQLRLVGTSLASPSGVTAAPAG